MRVVRLIQRLLVAAVILFPALATAAFLDAKPEEPTGLDDAGWVSLQAAIAKAVDQQSRLAAGSVAGADGAPSDGFGYAVALNGDTALVGVHLDDVGANSDHGSAYVFTRSGSSWTQQAKLTAADGAESDQFGFAVALDGDTALVGAYTDDVGGTINQGSTADRRRRRDG